VGEIKNRGLGTPFLGGESKSEGENPRSWRHKQEAEKGVTKRRDGPKRKEPNNKHEKQKAKKKGKEPSSPRDRVEKRTTRTGANKNKTAKQSRAPFRSEVYQPKKNLIKENGGGGKFRPDSALQGLKKNQAQPWVRRRNTHVSHRKYKADVKTHEPPRNHPKLRKQKPSDDQNSEKRELQNPGSGLWGH